MASERLHCWTASHFSDAFNYWKENWTPGELWEIFSGSLSSLQTIESKSNPILTEIQDELAGIGEKKTNCILKQTDTFIDIS
jgi:hypothetical protein